MQNELFQQAKQAAQELVAAANLKKGDILVVGCSSSEVAGGASFRALFDEHRARLQAIDVEDPDAWCAKRGFERR